MSLVLDILSWIALGLGGAFYLIGAIGLWRMPDLFTRMHGVSVSDTLGAGLLILGMMLQAGLTLVTVKLAIILLVLMVTGPVASHALARAALHDGRRPLLADEAGDLRETACDEISYELAERMRMPLSSETVEAPAMPAAAPATASGTAPGTASGTGEATPSKT